MYFSPFYGFHFDPTLMILLPGVIFAAYAQFKVSNTTSRYLKVRSERGYTGAQTATKILELNGLHDVRVEATTGHLTDHYDPRSKVVRLSQDIYHGTSITSIAVAAHECGHAIQHAKGYAALKFRSTLVPVVNFASAASWPLILLGLIMGAGDLAQVGIILFSATVLFQLVTLPVEFNASNRAMVQLSDVGILEGKELKQGRKVLTAAALTYVAALLTSILQLIRLVAIVNRRND